VCDRTLLPNSHKYYQILKNFLRVCVCLSTRRMPKDLHLGLRTQITHTSKIEINTVNNQH